MASTQCKRKECNIADVPSIITKMHNVNVNHMANKKNVMIMPVVPVAPNAFWSVMVHKTLDNWACAKDNAHNLRYDAV